MNNKSIVKSEIKESSSLVLLSLSKQEEAKYDEASDLINKAIEKIRKVLLIEGNKIEKDLILETYSLYERLKQNINQEEIYFKRKKSSDTLDVDNLDPWRNHKAKPSINEIYLDYSHLASTSDQILLMPIKILQRLGQSIESGSYFSEIFFIRKEVWYQNNAKITALQQKHEAYKLIHVKVDNLNTLAEKQVMNFSNIQTFTDILIDIQNSFAKEVECVRPSIFNSTKDLGKDSFYRKFSDLSAKLKSNLMSIKMSTVPDFVDVMLKLIKKSKDVENIFNVMNTMKLQPGIILEKKKIISNFFFNAIYKLIVDDMKELTLRFLKKKILCFEEK